VSVVAVISDTGPLSYLHRLGKLELLRDLYGRILVPPAVVAELGVGHRLGKDLPDVASHPWIEVRAPAAADMTGLDELGAGEAEGIALARSLPGALLILDDAEARRVAVAGGLRVTGTIGVLLLGKERGRVALIEPELARLRGFGFRLAEPVRLDILRRAGEIG
jgi:hypothetical protein